MRAFASAVALTLVWTGCGRGSVDVWTMGEGSRFGSPGAVVAHDVRLDALRGETVAFQIAVEAPAGSDVSLRLPPLKREGDPTEIALEAFVQRFVTVRGRSRNDHEGGSLAFTDAARPVERGLAGDVPDALVPLDIATSGPLRLTRAAQGRPTIFWVDVAVPTSAREGTFTAGVEVVIDGATDRTVPVMLRIDAPEMPYRGTSVFAFYDAASLGRFDDPIAVERRLVQTLHAHHVDALAQIVDKSQIQRTSGALDGSWFDDAYGYRGPGRGIPPEVVALGAYGSLGAPTPEGASLVRTLADALPRKPEDLFVYAVDEQCDSPFGADWKKLFVARRGIQVGHTCHEDPVTQKVDLVMMPAQAYAPARAAVAREAGKRVFVYNGQLPFAGPLMLDVPVTSLTVNGWIAARHDVTRWFYWETIFWNDGNRGGRGPRDVFVDPETFHNADGDVALYDGLLLFPGRSPAFPANDFATDDVFPSMRLKSLRRGIEDAGLVALAMRVDPVATRAIVDRIVPAAFDEVDAGERPRLALSASQLADARRELRQVLRSGEPSSIPDDAAAAARARGIGRIIVVLAGSLALSLLLCWGLRSTGGATARAP